MKLARLPDEALMEKIRQGNQAAFTELYGRYNASLLRYFTRMLWHNRALAEDFLHDFFLKVIRHPQYFDSSRRFSTWAYSIAHNMCKNEYRKKNNHLRLEGIDVKYAHDIDSELDLLSANDKLSLLMEKLAEEDKTILLLRYEEELSIGQISQILVVPEGTVKSRLFYLRKQLAGELIEFKNGV